MPSLCVLAFPAEPSGFGRGGRASGTGDGYINTVQRHAPAFLAFDVSRYTPITRPLMHLAPVRPLSGSFFGSRAILLNRCGCNERITHFTLHCSPPKEGAALTAVPEGEDVTVRGVRPGGWGDAGEAQARPWQGCCIRRPHQGRASASFGALQLSERTTAEERTRPNALPPCHRGRLRGIESGGMPGSCHDEGRAREAR